MEHGIACAGDELSDVVSLFVVNWNPRNRNAFIREPHENGF
jgi:hypothetical protein